MTQGWLAAYSVIENVTNVELCINSFFLSIFIFYFLFLHATELEAWGSMWAVLHSIATGSGTFSKPFG